MYPLEIKKKYRTFFVTFTNKEKPEATYLGMLYTAKTEIAVRVKIRDRVPNKFVIKRLVEIPHDIYTRLARWYNLKEKIRLEEYKKEHPNAARELMKKLEMIQSILPPGCDYYK